MTRENAEFLTTLRDVANCAATILDAFVKLRQEPRHTPADTDEDDEDDEPAQPHRTEAPAHTDNTGAPSDTPGAYEPRHRKAEEEPRHAEVPTHIDAHGELHRTVADPLADPLPEAPASWLLSTITCADCGCPQPDVLPDDQRGSACELCTITSALHRERQRRYEAARSSIEAVCTQIRELTELTYAALTTDGHRTLPTLDAELSRLVRAYRERTGPFARPERGVRA